MFNFFTGCGVECVSVCSRQFTDLLSRCLVCLYKDEDVACCGLVATARVFDEGVP